MESNAWEMPDATDRCPTCGRFVSLEDGYGDVEPGGCRGVDCVVPYCGEECADIAYALGHADPSRECDCEPD